jgi:5-methylcytosine-specific restriction endonuclease McrA
LVISCDGCSVLFCPLYGASNTRLCICCKTDRELQAKRTSRLTRKMRQRCQTVESVNPLKVFDRDKWTCQLCKKKTPKALRGSLDPRAPELDHIMPVSLGGEHSYRNTQCSCRACNGSKSNRPLGQMLLIG